MSEILKQLEAERYAKSVIESVQPISVTWKDAAEPATILFSDGQSSYGSCIRCSSPPCMEYSSSELDFHSFSMFPADQNNQVCPTSAVLWEFDSPFPTIDNDQCILCGICVARCPSRAIFMTDNGALINDEENSHFKISEREATEDTTKESASLFCSISESGSLYSETEDRLQVISTRIDEIASGQQSQFPNLLARNLLISTGINTVMRRRGDTNVRMDLLLSIDQCLIGPGEVEFSNAIIDVPRNLLDDVAVIVSRYGIDKEDIIAISILKSLPNQRSEYWQVVQDIRAVLDLKISSLTSGILFLLLWNRSSLSMGSLTSFSCIETSDFRRKLTEDIIKRPLNLQQGYPGLFESEK